MNASYDFSRMPKRLGTNCIKWDTLESTYHEENLLPMWIADMDFLAFQPIREKLQKVLDQGVLGYAFAGDDLYQAVIDWQERHHHISYTKNETLFISGVVPAIAVVIQALSAPGEAVMINDPVYPPFTNVIRTNDRKLVRSALKVNDRKFLFDFPDIEEKFKKENVKLFILCSPHNPGGRVWTKTELNQLGELCRKYRVKVISDEIHQDLIYPGNAFTTFFNCGDFDDFAVTLTAPTKTFNLAGIKNSMIFVKNQAMRQAIKEVMLMNKQDEINTFGYAGTQAAYELGDKWLADLLIYLEENMILVRDFLKTHLPKIKMMTPEGTYLIWLDFSAYGLSDKALEEKMIHEAKVVLNPGISFGPAGSGHMRFNIACPQENVLEALRRIQNAFAK